jgi:hypothetical protein
MAWYVGGGWGAFAAMTAVIWRAASGQGQFIDCSPAEAEMRFTDYDMHWYHANKRIRERLGALNVSVFPYTLIKTKDSYSFIAGFSDINWTGLTNIIQRPDLKERFPTTKARIGESKLLHRAGGLGRQPHLPGDPRPGPGLRGQQARPGDRCHRPPKPTLRYPRRNSLVGTGGF